MPAVLPFRAFRYTAARTAALSRLISPPYDAVSPALREELAARSAHNVVHALLPPELPGDAPGERHERARRTLESWEAQGVLRQDPSPSLYALEQRFTGPDGRPTARLCAVAAVRLHAYAEGKILPHEKTLHAPLADRLELLRRVQFNLSPVFALFEDPRRDGVQVVQAMAQGEPVAEADSDDGVHHRLWRAEDAALVGRLRELLSERTLLLADGHHRYEAALAYRDLVDREQPGLPASAGHRYMMMALCSMADPGLVVYPTHRLVFGLPGFRLDPFIDLLGRYFKVDALPEDLRRPAGRAWAISKLAEHAGKSTAFLLVTAEDKRGRILTLKDESSFAGVALPANQTVRDLDVTALHALVFQHLLGISPEAQQRQDHVSYEMDAGAAVARVLSGEFPMGFLVNPTPMWQVQAVAESGETMPQKSTSFFPKLASGLLFRKLGEPVE